jgi:eukaryotic-like serine/threonine-protein kinase
VPLEQATTSSLDALKAYSLAYAQANKGALLASIPLYKKAIELDSDFAAAYAHLGQAYANSSQEELATGYIKRAFERRARASEVEKFYITTRYYELVDRDVEKRIEALELWGGMYPRNGTPHNDLASEFVDMGRFDQGLAEAQEAVRLAPAHYTGYELLGMSYLGLNRFAEAKAIREKQVADNVGDHWDHVDLYGIAFLQHDAVGMQRETDWAKGKKYEFLLLRTMAGLAAYEGKLQTALQNRREASESARRAGFKEIAQEMAMQSALMETLAGNVHQKIDTASIPAGNDQMLRNASHIYAIAGDAEGANAIADQMSKEEPTATYVNKVWVPIIRAESEISRGNPGKAIEWLQSAIPYEFGWKASLWPSYVRGRAYLKAKQGNEAVAEFKRILEHRGSCFADSMAPLMYALSYLQLGRAEALSGDMVGARKTYGDFLALWKDADSDIPVLKEAKSEYAKLR